MSAILPEKIPPIIPPRGNRPFVRDQTKVK